MRHRGNLNDHLARWPLYATIAFILLSFLLGGASRPDVVQVVVLRPLAVILICTVLCFSAQIDWRAIKWPGGLLFALAALMIFQLVPLPWSWWTALPGRDLAREVLEAAGSSGAAHGLSITPGRTLNSLFSLSVPAAALLAMASLSQEDRRTILPWLLIGIIASLLLGFAQLVQGRFYIYSVTNAGSAVGFFANRNHNAALVAAAPPLLVALATWPFRRRNSRPVWLLAAVGVMILLVLGVLAIGSRWGLAVAGIGIVWAMLVARNDLRHLLKDCPRMVRLTMLAIPASLFAGLVALAALASRDEALRRLFEVQLVEDIRFQTLPITTDMMVDLFPFGAGFGSFDALYRIAEPENLLGFQYLNHIHNDYVEFLLEGGVAGLALMLVAAAWYTAKIFQSFRRGAFAEGIDQRIALAASGVLLVGALASVTDYPLRTPIWMMVWAVCTVWLTGSIRSDSPKTHGSTLRDHASSSRRHRPPQGGH